MTLTRPSIVLLSLARGPPLTAPDRGLPLGGGGGWEKGRGGILKTTLLVRISRKS